MNDLNILILSAGRRVELVQCFKAAAQKLQISAKVVAGDCSNIAPALYFADKAVVLPKIHEPNYIDEIINICKANEIALVIPTIDTDLLLLAEQKERIESISGTKLLLSDLNVVAICRDKVEFQRFLENHKFQIPKMYTNNELDSTELSYPLFIKPKSGSSSVNTFKVCNRAELNTYRQIVNQPIIQDYISGQEFTVDVFLDFSGKVITIVPRERIATRSGEISKGKIVKDTDIIEDVKRLVDVLKPIGHITVQLMKTEKGIEYIEINPRFGGGAPMSIKSGADSCENLYKLLMGEKLDYNESYRDQALFLRYDSAIALDENMEIIEW
ncbi:ATP-grasp domain-containing protein [Paenibacillus sp. MMS20-IR301]|uniref:ATP-grasp domain-containing protein n=1 Tax=Paenibacillus sp. MMS20-IR301 TaxID=2895946 RepID=UPI0028E1CE6A|nr:ATP-grasp domain-containing protein [Paenibacillus sp. MMS20-IR301]WNS43525.1 ATP-grasp domain-containing protein [Paenibacillus sp. MMS20-IR301]